MDPQVAEQNLTGRANDWIRKAINWTIVTDWTLRTLHLTNHKVECPRLTRNRVKDFFVRAIRSHPTWFLFSVPAIVAFTAAMR